MVGFGDMLQQTPLAVTSAPPSKVTFPPLDAVFDVIAVTAVVLTVGVITALEYRQRLWPSVPAKTACGLSGVTSREWV